MTFLWYPGKTICRQIKAKVSPKPFLHLSSCMMLCVHCFSNTWEILCRMSVGMLWLPGVWEYRASLQNLPCWSEQHFEKEKVNMLGKLQRYFLSPVCPAKCLSQKAFCMLALSVRIARAELASSLSFLPPRSYAPFWHPLCIPCCDLHREQFVAGVVKMKTLLFLFTNYVKSFHSNR